MTDTSAIVEDLCSFIGSHALSDEPIRPETDLLSSGLLDSMLVIDLVSHVEAAHGVALADADITPKHFRSVTPLAALIVARKGRSE